jgi:hypothetical protein
MHNDIGEQEAGVYAETADGISVSFRTTELFHGWIGDCLTMLRHYTVPARAAVYIESIDGLIQLAPPEISDHFDRTPGAVRRSR